MQLFTPSETTAKIAATSITSRVALPLGNGSIRLANFGDSIIFVQFGDAVVNASTLTSMPILPNTAEAFRTSAAYIAAVCGSGETGTLYITNGDGA